jgi:hypothetical protein
MLVAYNILRTPELYEKHFERYAASVVSIIGFGRRISDIHDPIISEVLAVMQRAAELNVPGKTFPMLMETFPCKSRKQWQFWNFADHYAVVLARFPTSIAPWKHGLGKPNSRGGSFYFALAEEARDNPAQEQCYVKKIFREAPNYDLKPQEIAALTGNLFGAGSDTSSSTLVTFVLACCAFPEVLPKAWEELDRVVGPKRSPTMDDEPNLPYIKAFVKEVFRWRSVAIIGGQPHAPIQQDTYKAGLSMSYCTLF